MLQLQQQAAVIDIAVAIGDQGKVFIMHLLGQRQGARRWCGVMRGL